MLKNHWSFRTCQYGCAKDLKDPSLKKHSGRDAVVLSACSLWAGNNVRRIHKILSHFSIYISQTPAVLDWYWCGGLLNAIATCVLAQMCQLPSQPQHPFTTQTCSRMCIMGQQGWLRSPSFWLVAIASGIGREVSQQCGVASTKKVSNQRDQTKRDKISSLSEALSLAYEIADKNENEKILLPTHLLICTGATNPWNY